MSRAITFTQAQVRRAVRGAESAGLHVRKVTVKPDGSIVVEGGENKTPVIDSPKMELASWDDDQWDHGRPIKWVYSDSPWPIQLNTGGHVYRWIECDKNITVLVENKK